MKTVVLLPLLTYIDSCSLKIWRHLFTAYKWSSIRSKVALKQHAIWFSAVSCKNMQKSVYCTGYFLEFLVWVRKKRKLASLYVEGGLTRQPTAKIISKKTHIVHAQYITKYTVSVYYACIYAISNFIVIHFHPTYACTFQYPVDQKPPKCYQKPLDFPFDRLRCSRFPCTSVCACARLDAPARCIFSPNILSRGSDHLGRVFSYFTMEKLTRISPYSTTMKAGFGQSHEQSLTHKKSSICYGNTGKYHQLSNKHIEMTYVFQHPMFHFPKTPTIFTSPWQSQLLLPTLHLF